VDEGIIRTTQVLAMKRLGELLAMTVMLFVLMAAAVGGQSALDGFDPNANGTVNVVVFQPDGKILIGGEFTMLSPNGGVAVTRNRIARLDATNGLADSNPEKQPSPDRNNFPDSTTDLDDSDGGLDDFNADTSTRKYQDTPLFTVTGLDAVTRRAPGIIPVLLFPIRCSCCPRDHIRERAPPRPGIKL
jgi:hypothetical protein